MSARPIKRRHSAQDLETILGVTSALAAPFDLMTMLAEVVRAAKQVLKADRGSVWLYDTATDELVLEVATGIKPVRVPAGAGLAGACARHRQIINVPDCYADPRFDPGVDKSSGYRTRCMLTLPLVDHKDVLVGVMQVLNKAGGGIFDAHDEALAAALAAQCAVALQRVRMTEAVIEGEKMRQELEMARVVQMGTLPATMPSLPGYDVYGTFKPATLTGGDTFDLAVLDQGLLAVLGDATGHGIAPALSVTQMQAMLRMAFRLGADLETAFMEVNNQLADTLASDRFITAFIGLLDAPNHRMRFLSGGQGPIVHFQAASGTCARYKPTSFPLGAMHLSSLKPAVTLQMLEGDILVLVSDGIYEYHNACGEQFGEKRVEDIVRAHHRTSMADLSAILLDSVQAFASGAPQDDDITVVLVKRAAAAVTAHKAFKRDFDSLQGIFEFTADVFARQRIDSRILPVVDLAVEELFTNMVKYST
ncbi:MAG: PP2C family protein-serine/threonine phosphatase, partial [Casimicrobiaceae bacterium]